MELRRLQIAEEKRLSEQHINVKQQRNETASPSRNDAMATSTTDDESMSIGSGATGEERTNRPSTPRTGFGEDARAFNTSRTGTDSMSGSADEGAATTQADTDMASTEAGGAADSAFFQYSQDAAVPEYSGSLFEDMPDVLEDTNPLSVSTQTVTREHSLFGDGLFGALSPDSLAAASRMQAAVSQSPVAPHPSLASMGSLPSGSPAYNPGGNGAFSVPHSQYQSPVGASMLPPPASSTGAIGMLERPVHGGQNADSLLAAASNAARLNRLQELQDALFVHDAGLPIPNPTSPVTSTEASLFASLRNSVAGKAGPLQMMAAQVIILLSVLKNSNNV